jgi:hypothetical protein
MAQLQHNRWVTNLRCSVLSIITDGGKWVQINYPHGPAVSDGPGLGGKAFWPPRPRIEAIRIVDMSSSNSWAEFAALFCNRSRASQAFERGAASFDLLETEASHAPVQSTGWGSRLSLGQGAGRARGLLARLEILV